MTQPLDLDTIEKACQEATPGPWIPRLGGYAVHRPNTEKLCSEIETVDGKAVFGGDGGAIGLMADGLFVSLARTWVPALVARVRELERANANLNETLRLSEERWASYYEDIERTNEALDAAGMHVGASDLETLVNILIADADNGRKALLAEREACAKVAEAEKCYDRGDYRLGFDAARENIARAIRERTRGENKP